MSNAILKFDMFSICVISCYTGEFYAESLLYCIYQYSFNLLLIYYNYTTEVHR